jgi:hypothetical protein
MTERDPMAASRTNRNRARDHRAFDELRIAARSLGVELRVSRRDLDAIAIPGGTSLSIPATPITDSVLTHHRKGHGPAASLHTGLVLVPESRRIIGSGRNRVKRSRSVSADPDVLTAGRATPRPFMTQSLAPEACSSTAVSSLDNDIKTFMNNQKKVNSEEGL